MPPEPLIPEPGDQPSPTPDPPPAPEASERPDWIPEDAWDAEAGAPLLDKLGEVVTAAGKDTDIPAEVSAYTPPAIEGLTADQITADPLYQSMAQLAHSTGVGQERFAKAVEAHIKAALEAEDTSRTEQLALLGDKAAERLQVVSNWMGSKLTADEVSALRGTLTTAKGIEALEKLMNAGVSSAPRTPPPPPAPIKTEAQIREMMNDPRYYDQGKRDKDYVKQVDDAWAALAAAEAAKK